MKRLTIRPATPEDAAAITAIHCSHISVWRRGGKGDIVPYEALSPYEQWLHGGPWMNAETCAAHLRRWQETGHLTLVALLGEEVVGEAEFVEDEEPLPYGHVLHLSLLIVHRAYLGQGVGRALVDAGVTLARERGCIALTTQPEQAAEPFYHRVGFEPWLWLREWQAPAREVFLPADLRRADDAPYPAGQGLVLRVGRYQASRHMWYEMANRPLPELARLPWGRWQAPMPGGEKLWLGLRAQPLAPTQADGFIWMPPGADLRPAVEALQSLAARLGFAFVDLLMEEPEGRALASALDLEFQTDLTFWRMEIGEQSP
ncbi:MAG: GNAT family N-acetyltransferase [Anaerolineae bacterium]|nr:GNAT family N-acetyltransferase [Anaerolineae bacterium]MDW8069510.1 GNAT family N-acetyltransferase [Anaerolineae bacterium]